MNEPVEHVEFDLEKFAQQLANATKNHKEWLAVMNFGKATLIDNQLLLIRLIIDEAIDLAAPATDPLTIGSFVVLILQELGLTLTT